MWGDTLKTIILNTLFYKMLLSRLDDGFELNVRSMMNDGSLMFKTDKAFLYANISNILDISNNHNLSDLEYNFRDAYIKSYNYNYMMIKINLAIIASKTLKRFTRIIFNAVPNSEKEFEIAYLKYSGYKNIADLFDNSFNPTLEELDYIKYLYEYQQYFPLGDKYFNNALLKFEKIIKKHHFISKKYSDYNYNIKTSFTDDNLTSPIYNNKSFIDIINTALDGAYNEANKYLKGLLNL